MGCLYDTNELRLLSPLYMRVFLAVRKCWLNKVNQHYAGERGDNSIEKGPGKDKGMKAPEEKGSKHDNGQ